MADVVALLKNPRGARAVVVGGGKTGAAAARLLGRLGAQVSVLDDAGEDKVNAGLTKAGLDVEVEIVAGGIDAGRIASADVVVLSPGVPRAHPSIAPSIAAGVPFVNEIELAAAHLPADVAVIAITGTNGKSTTTTMCGAIAKAYDKDAFVGGNLGTPYCDAVLSGRTPKVAVLELSSYQLETISRLGVRAAVVTNLSPDHLDRYPNVETYYAAKARIFSLVEPGGGVAINAADAETRAHLIPRIPGGLARCDFDVSSGLDGIEIRGSTLILKGGAAFEEIGLDNPRIVGRHNRANAAAAVAGAFLAGVSIKAWQQGLDAYAGIAHRLERVGEARGVIWFNDSKATNVDAALTGLKSFDRGVHLIVGGLGKGAPYEPLVEAAKGRVECVYTIGKDAPAIAAAFKGHVPLIECDTLEVACEKAGARAKPGEVVLLSPACASFDQFRDYVHRGERFRELFAQFAGGGPS